MKLTMTEEEGLDQTKEIRKERSRIQNQLELKEKGELRRGEVTSQVGSKVVGGWRRLRRSMEREEEGRERMRLG